MKKLDCYMSSCHTICRKDWTACIDWVRAAGFSGLELFDEENENFSTMSPERAAELGQQAKEAGVVLSAHPWINWAELPEEEMIARCRRVVSCCAQMGVTYLNMHLNFVSDRKQGMQRLFRATDACLQQIADAGMTLLYENVPEYGKRELGSEAADFDALFRYYPADVPVGMNIDTGHAHIMHHLMPLAQEHGDRWVYTHINDNDQLKDHHYAPGDGTLDFSLVAGLAEKIGYTGPLLMEYNQRGLASGMAELERTYGAVGYALDRITL